MRTCDRWVYNYLLYRDEVWYALDPEASGDLLGHDWLGYFDSQIEAAAWVTMTMRYRSKHR